MDERPRGTGKRLAVILVRGRVNVKQRVKETLDLLRLKRKNHCLVVEDTPIVRGMIQLVKDYITWGEIDDKTFTELVEKRGEEYNGRETDRKGKITYNKWFVQNGRKYKKYFRLNPPRKGFGRKGIKMPFLRGGALGYRGEKINDLIRRMV
jgi:large subunit ribosomal protein L30